MEQCGGAVHQDFIVENSSRPVVANLQEAVIYGKVEIVPTFLTDFSDKIKHLKTLVVERIVICCRDMKTTNVVVLMVSELGVKATVLHSGQDMSESRSIFSRWCNAPVTPLVFSDTSWQWWGRQGHSLDPLGPSHRQQDQLLTKVHLHQQWGEEHLQLRPSTTGQGHPHAGTSGCGQLEHHHPLP